MSGDVQLDEAPAALLGAARSVVPGWVRRLAVGECTSAGIDPDSVGRELDLTVAAASEAALADLADLLATDVDDQRSTPLSLLRATTERVGVLLRASGVAVPEVDRRDTHRDPVGPATWSDVDPALHGPGLTWGAWKAMTILGRRRDEGLR